MSPDFLTVRNAVVSFKLLQPSLGFHFKKRHKKCVHAGLSYVLTLRKATMLIAFSGDSLEKLEERKIRLDMNI